MVLRFSCLEVLQNVVISHSKLLHKENFCCSHKGHRFFSSDQSLPLKIIEVTTSTFLVELLQTKIHGGIKELLVVICKTQALGVFQQQWMHEENEWDLTPCFQHGFLQLDKDEQQQPTEKIAKFKAIIQW